MLQNHDVFLEAQCEVEEALGRNPGAIALIKALREHSPMGLKEAKDIVDDFLKRRSAGGGYARSQPAVSISSQAAAEGHLTWLREHIAQMEAARQKPQYISLIRDLREHSNLGLKEAKDTVDDFCARERPDMHDGTSGGLLGNLAKMFGLE